MYKYVCLIREGEEAIEYDGRELIAPQWIIAKRWFILLGMRVGLGCVRPWVPQDVRQRDRDWLTSLWWRHTPRLWCPASWLWDRSPWLRRWGEEGLLDSSHSVCLLSSFTSYLRGQRWGSWFRQRWLHWMLKRRWRRCCCWWLVNGQPRRVMTRTR